MKRILFFILILAGCFGGTINALAWNEGNWGGFRGNSENADWQGWQDQEAKAKKSGKRYCSGTQEKELLLVLQELNKPFGELDKSPGRRSKARWQYSLVQRLRKFDDCRAEDALQKLSKENLCEEWGEGDVFCVKWSADIAREDIESRADLKKLALGLPLSEQLKIITKYTKRPYKNNFAADMVADYLTKQARQQPKVYLPLLVELFPHKPQVETIARRYPAPADEGILKLLADKDFEQVWWGINLARYLDRRQFLARIYDVAFAGKGSLDYRKKNQLAEIKTAAMGYLKAMAATSYLQRAAADKFDPFADYCASASKGCKTSAKINRFLDDLAANSGGFAVTVSIGKGSGDGEREGKDIRAILIAENADWHNNHGRPTVIITGAIHGNEWATPEVCLGIASYLLANRDNSDAARDDMGDLINAQTGDAKLRPPVNNIRDLLKVVQVIIIPVLNPDGYDYSHTPAGKKSYYGAGWRPNRRERGLLDKAEVCYKKDGTPFAVPPGAEHCFLADYDDTLAGGDFAEEEVMVCESYDHKHLRLFEPELEVASSEMFDAIYDSVKPRRVVCASGQRRVWKEQWDENDDDSVPLDKAVGYLQESFGVDLNRNFKYKWDVTQDQKKLFIRTRTPSSRMYRGRNSISEAEIGAMERLIAREDVVALIDYHSGSTQVLYPYAFSISKRADKGLFKGKWAGKDYDVFRRVSEKIAALLNRHDRGDASISNFTSAQNYNDVSVGSGVARDCYYQTEGIAAINIEVHDKRYTYGHEEFRKVVPQICQNNIPGAVWFLFWAAGLSQGGGT